MPHTEAALRAAADGERSLDELERWFQDEVVRPHERRAPAAKARATGARERAQDWVLPSRHLRPAQRIAIYTQAYFIRLHECLQSDYPAVARLCGEVGFERLVRAYLRVHPSRHYSLNVLGRKLPEFLDGPVRIARRALLADVARLEQRMAEVFDERDTPVLTPADFAALPASVWDDAYPQLIAALRVEAFDHRANAIVSAARQEQSLPPLGRQQTWVAIYRKDDVLWRMDLTQPMYEVLRALREGASLRAAIEAGARVFAGTPAEMQAQVFGWFAEWVGEGFFSAVASAPVERAG